MKKIIKIIALLLISMPIFSAESGVSMAGQPINYDRVFDQKAIYKKFPELMRYLGCDENVFGEPKDQLVSYTESNGCGEVRICVPTLERVAEVSRMLSIASGCTKTYKTYKDELPKFQKACLARLRSERRWALTAPGREALIQIGIGALIAYGTTSLSGVDSLGGSISIYGAVANSAYQITNVVKSGLALVYPSSMPLNKLEEFYAVNRCFIPRALWPKITEKFITAKYNSYQADTATKFVEFALGLTLYKPKKDLPKVNVDAIMIELERRIDDFFLEYDIKMDSPELRLLKSSIYDFINKLIFDKGQLPKYQYLYGTGGIGKTHFVRKLSEWIEELVPNSIHYEDVVIKKQEELAGTDSTPGILLRILRNQLQQLKRGTIVFMDEATWLNQMVSDSKIVFNGDQSRISTQYFGTNIDGTAIELDVPPMLIFVASNSDINDEHLKGRFAIFNFPKPTKHALKKYSYELLKENELNNLLKRRYSVDKTAEAQGLIETKIDSEKDLISFRQVQALIGPALYDVYK